MAQHNLKALAAALALTFLATPASIAEEPSPPDAAPPAQETNEAQPPGPDEAQSSDLADASSPDVESQDAEAQDGDTVNRARNVNLNEPISSTEANQSANEPDASPAPAEPEEETTEETAEPAPASDEPAPAAEPATGEEVSTGEPAAEEPNTPAPRTDATPADESPKAEDEAPATADPVEQATASADTPTQDAAGDTENTAEATPAPEDPPPPPFVMLGTEVPPATSTRLAWATSQSFEGIYSATPVLVVNGAEPGPVLCLTAAVHGDELNGVETVRRVLYNLDAQKLRGTVVGVPIVNLQGFHRSSRYLSDRRDLNRYFPGDPGGSLASRIAYSFFREVIQHCSALVDLHTGSFYRTNLPQLRGDLRNPKVVKLTEGFGSTVVLHSDGAEGTLRRAAVEAGIPAVTLEAGAPMVLSEDNVAHSVKGVRTLLNHLDMLSKFRLWGDPEPIYYNSTWQRAPEGGIVFSKVSLGQNVRKGDLLGTVTNPITNVRTEIRSSYNGRIIGMALNQVVQPGFATHHIGIEAPEEQISSPEDVDVPADPNSPPGPDAEPATAVEPPVDTAEHDREPTPPAQAEPVMEPAESDEDGEDGEDDVPFEDAEDEDFEAMPQPLDDNEDDMAE